LLIFKQEKLCSQIYVDPNIENIFPANFFIHGNVSADKDLYKSTNVTH
jgi:hypothetical protein